MSSPNTCVAAALLLISAAPAAACDPIITSPKDVLARHDLSFVVGRYSSDGTFIVDHVIGGTVTRRAYRLFERGPFGSQCEIRVMKVASPSRRDFAATTRFLLPVEKEDGQRHQLLVVMGYPYRLVVKKDMVVDQYFGTSSRLSDLKRAMLNARPSRQ